MRLTPDGARYLAMADGHRQPLPFHLRPLLPAICGQSEVRWIVATVLSTAAAVMLTGALALQHGATPAQAVVAMLLLAGLPWVRFALSAPVLVDMPGLACALAAAVLWPASGYAAVACLIVGALISEKVPVLAALFAWSPLPLVALMVPLLVYCMFDPAPVDARDRHAETLTNPFRSALKAHRGLWRNPFAMLTPWGACLAVALEPSLWVAAALVVGYSQLLAATDTVRLYQTVAPVLCVAAALVIPTAWAVPVIAAHWFNPWMGDGI